jgi:dGTPase
MRIDALVHDLVETSDAAGDIVQSPPFADALLELRAFMFEHIYLGPLARAENADAAAMVKALFDHHLALTPDPVAVTDWVSGMTDQYALRAFGELT